MKNIFLRRIERLERVPLRPEAVFRAQKVYRETGQLPPGQRLAELVQRIAAMTVMADLMSHGHREKHAAEIERNPLLASLRTDAP